MSNSDQQIQPTSIEEVKPSVEAKAADSSPAEKGRNDGADGVLYVSAQMKNTRQKIGYLFAILKQDRPVSLKAYGSAIAKAIGIATLVRSKHGDLHQVLRVTESKDDKREKQGIEIVLSAKPLDQEEIGYQAPEPKGFWVPKKRERPADKKPDDKPAEAEVKQADAPEQSEADKPKKKRKYYRKKSQGEEKADAPEKKVSADASTQAKQDPPAAAEKEERSNSKPRRNKRPRKSKRGENSKQAEASDGKENAQPVAAAQESSDKRNEQSDKLAPKSDKAQDDKFFEGGQASRSRKPQQEHDSRQPVRYPRKPYHQDFFRDSYRGYYPYQPPMMLPAYRQNYARYFNQSGANNASRHYHGRLTGSYRQQNPTSYRGGRQAPEPRQLTKWSEGSRHQQE